MTDITTVDTGRVDCGDVELAYRAAGDPAAPLVLCLHGFPDTPHHFDALLPALAAAGYHAVAPWMRGFAPSGLARDDCYEIFALTADAVALTEHFAGDRPAVIVGHDWGAAATYGACASRPELFRSAVAMSLPHPLTFATTLLSSFAQQRASFYIWLFQLRGIAEGIVGANDLAFIDDLVAVWSPGWDRDETLRAALRAALGAPANLTAALTYYRASFDPTVQRSDDVAIAARAACTAPVGVPTLFVHGRDDGCALVDAMPPQDVFFPAGLETVLVDGAGHFPLCERPDEVLPLLLAHIGPPDAD